MLLAGCVAFAFALWSTCAHDADVLFLGVVAAGAAGAARLLLNPGEGASVDLLPPLALPDCVPRSWDDRTLKAALAAGFVFLCGPVGSVVFSHSPFAGTVLYTSVLAALLGEARVADDVRLHVIAMALLASVLSEHVLRANVATLVFASVCALVATTQQQQALLSSRAFEVLALWMGLLLCLVHDAVVRFALKPVQALVHSFFLATTAYVIIDSVVELAGLHGEDYDMLRVSWDTILPNVNDLARQLLFPGKALTTTSTLQAAPALAVLFCLAYTRRALRLNWDTMNWIRYQELCGVGVGTIIGLQLWIRYAGVPPLSPYSPLSLCWAAAAILARVSAFVVSASKSADAGRMDVHRIQYWKRPEQALQARQLARAKHHASSWSPNGGGDVMPFPLRFLETFSVAYPDVFEVANQTAASYRAVSESAARVKRCTAPVASSQQLQSNGTGHTQQHANDSSAKTVEVAKRYYAFATALSLLCKNLDRLAVKVTEAMKKAELETAQLEQIPGFDASLYTRSKNRHFQIQQDLASVTEYAEAMHKELTAKDAEALKVLEQAVPLVANDPTESDSLELMSETLKKRMKNRHFQGATNDANNNVFSPPPTASAASSPVSPPASAAVSGDAASSASAPGPGSVSFYVDSSIPPPNFDRRSNGAASSSSTSKKRSVLSNPFRRSAGGGGKNTPPPPSIPAVNGEPDDRSERGDSNSNAAARSSGSFSSKLLFSRAKSKDGSGSTPGASPREASVENASDRGSNSNPGGSRKWRLLPGSQKKATNVE